MQDDSELLLLMQRDRMDGDSKQHQFLTEEVFKEPFSALNSLLKTLAPEFDSHLLAVSIFGLVMHNFELGTIRTELPGYKNEHEDPKVVAEHVVRLVLQGVAQAR